MRGQINATFGTFQADMFESGLAAEIGANPFVVWLAIKAHSDFNSGESWPSIRRLSSLTGLGVNTVQRALDRLTDAHLLRIVSRGNRKVSTRYVARERLDVRLGNQLLCTIVIDYVPSALRKKVKRIQNTLAGGEHDPEAFAAAEIIPGTGFVWDAVAGVLRSHIPASSIPRSEPVGIDASQFAGSVLAQKVAGIQAAIANRKVAQKLGGVSMVDTG